MIDQFEFPVEIVRTNRKRSASIQLDGVGIKIRIPKTLSDKRINALIVKRSKWIQQKLKEAALSPPVEPKAYVHGENFLYLGQDYQLSVLSGQKQTTELKGNFLEVTIADKDKNHPDSIRSMLIRWYKQQAEVLLVEKTRAYAGLIGVEPQSIVVKDYKSRWGSCSINGDISYNWRIIMAPDHIVDYVVVHELCHLLEHNHSSRYWQHVERYVSDYKQRRNWLKTAGNQLTLL